MFIRLVENPQLRDGTLRIDSPEGSFGTPTTIEFAKATKTVCVEYVDRKQNDVVSAESTTYRIDEFVGYLSSDIHRELRLPAEACLHLQQRNGVLRVGPCVAFYVMEKARTGGFGEQTRLLQDFACCGSRLGIDVILYVPGSLESGRGYRYNETEACFEMCDVPLADVVYRRSGAFGILETSAARELERLKRCTLLLTLPRSCSNKWNLYQLLRKQRSISATLPSTVLAVSPIDVLNRSKERRDVYVKPIAGSQGASIYRLQLLGNQLVVKWEEPPRQNSKRRDTCARSLRECRFPLDDETQFSQFWRRTGLKRCIVQDTVRFTKTKTGLPFDFRWLIQSTKNGPIVAARVARVGNQGSITTNIHTGGRALDVRKALALAGIRHHRDVIRALDEVALDTYACLRRAFGAFGEVGVDLALTDDGNVALFEVNPTPGRRMLRLLNAEAREMSLIRLLEYANFATEFDDEK